MRNSLIGNRICLVVAALPPALDGIGDYTARLSTELARSGMSVSVLVGQADFDAIPGVMVTHAFDAQVPASTRGLASHIQAVRPDWLLLQYNAFSFGRRGLNLFLPLTIRSLVRRQNGMKFAMMVHEPFVPILDVKHAVMTTYQRWQLRTLGRAASVVFVSTAPWADSLCPWFPSADVLALPVGSNIPDVGLMRAEARARLDIQENETIFGVFGGAHNSRLPERVKESAEAAMRAGRKIQVLSLGPDAAAMRKALGESIPLRADGAQPAEEISRRFSAMDIFLSPFVDGISTRRTSLMTALQHGIPTVGTKGGSTSELLKNEDGNAYLLADADAPEQFARHVEELLNDEKKRERIGKTARLFYEREFAWPQIAARLTQALERR